MLNRFLLFTQCLAWLADPVTDSSPFLRPESNIVNHRSSTEFRHVRNSGPGGVDGPIYLARDSSGLFVASSAGVLRAIIYDDDILVPSIVDQPGSVTSSARHKRTSSTPAFFSGRVDSSAGRMLNRFLLFTQAAFQRGDDLAATNDGRNRLRRKSGKAEALREPFLWRLFGAACETAPG
ncbi:hypothetical protein HPB50_001912 [Hyalomma asiaticum]|uniref:Uncharacterized protein n=1 Tax=Hyalomma asiaticum TaxID=266040 RepID=A0ACB7TCX0_HYAAI|nr:hypothetical protein HPB50_001912 [Hyalomma asiaticum]